MSKPNRIRQLYGYAVCLVAVITGLISINGIVQNAIKLSDPLAAANEFGENVLSFDAWMASRYRYSGSAGEANARDTTSVATLRARFEALQTSRIAQQAFRAKKDLVTDLTVLLVAVVLFISHWLWLRRSAEDGPTTAATG